MEKKQQMSLLTFFSKSPKVATPKGKAANIGNAKVNNNNDDNGVGIIDEDKRNAEKTTTGPNNSNQNGSSPELEEKTTKRSSASDAKCDSGVGKTTSGADRLPGDVVWARLEGYPWWPSMVCVAPNSKGGVFSRLGKIHVQFFDSISSHAWVKRESIADFRSKDQVEWGGEFWCRDPEAKKSAALAEKALSVQDTEERLKQFAAELHDDDVMEEEEEKENVETEEAKSKKRRREDKEDATPSKKTNDGSDDSNNKRRRIIQRVDSSDEEEEEETGAKKRIDDDDDDEEFKPPVDKDETDDEEVNEEDEEMEESSASSEEGLDDIKAKYGQKKKSAKAKNAVKKTSSVKTTSKSMSLPTTPKAAPPSRASVGGPSAAAASSSPKPASTSASLMTKLSHFAAPSEEDDSSSGIGGENGVAFKHESYEFLKPEKIRDGNRRRPEDPNYDPRTLYVPSDFLNQQTPAQRQWWEFKAKHFDTILFFKQGKFYELYHTDCVLAVKECGLAFMKGDHAHCGFPEKAGPRYAEALIQKGYAVARIEQTETPDMMQERVKGMSRPTKFDKVVKREICAITTKATRRFGYMDKEASDDTAAYLLAICEKEMVDGVDGKPQCHYGIAFVDAAVGKFVVGQFVDDRLSSRLRTLLAHWPPQQILYGKGDKMLTPKTLRLLKATCPSAIMTTPLVAGNEFWEAEKTLKTLAESDYFKDESTKEFEWPAKLRDSLLSEADALGLTPKSGRELAVRSLGALIWYLKKCVIDHELLSMKLFDVYEPRDSVETEGERPSTATEDDRDDEYDDQDDEYMKRCKFMVLDGLTMNNLEVLSVDGNLEGSLLAKIDHASTPFGKRLLREWLAAPLCDLKSIQNRQDAVDDLIENRSLMEEAGAALKKLPDLERLLSRIHAMGSKTRHENHPDGRAVIFEADIFDKRKIEDFIKILEGYERAIGVVETFQKDKSLTCSRLKQLTTFSSAGGSFPDLEDELHKFASMFDREKARKDGVVEPTPGVDAEFDDAIEAVEERKKALNGYRKKLEKELECAVAFHHQGKTTYQLEIPDKKKLPSKYRLVSSKKGFKRYHTDEVIRLRDELLETELHRDELIKATSRKVFRKFDSNARMWTKACRNLATLDALCSLAKYSVEGSAGMVRPEFVSAEKGVKPFVEIRDGVHPTIVSTFSGDEYIPNDILIGLVDENDDAAAETTSFSSPPSTVLVTGPNMGGKSTLMRQAATLVILAQLGCRIPASKCRLTPVDRIFTRLGARDNIVGGESTFFVEMSETTSILRHATRHSLVLVDELGRGTSTYDGTAVASAVLQELVSTKKCRCLFSTHYHLLVDDFKATQGVRLGHMACMVENQNEEDPTAESITFLYKFIAGNCPRSYGFNTAKLAGVPDDVVRKAHGKAKEMESGVDKRKAFKELMAGKWEVKSF